MRQFILTIIVFFLYLQLLAQDASIIYNNTVNSTVTIETKKGMGSGFFIEKDIIVTNFHVIKDAKYAHCYTNNDTTKYKIEGYLAIDETVDLALLKVSQLNRTPLKLATTTVSPGQKVYVIGSPKGLVSTISDGIVGGLRDFNGYKLIQITAPISPGSSGGPVLNSKGELIGVAVCQLKEGQNLNFAIPKENIELLLKFKKDYITPFTPSISFDIFTDSRDGKTYKTVEIGNQTWMAENLNYKTNKGSWCYEDNTSYCAVYGRLYDSETARKVCPVGWHLPKLAEWTLLADYLGGEKVAGEGMKEVGESHWSSRNTDADNSSGFTALPGGYRYVDGSFKAIRYHGNWWSTTYTGYWSTTEEKERDDDKVWTMELYSDRPNLEWYANTEDWGFSVRCVRD